MKKKMSLNKRSNRINVPNEDDPFLKESKLGTPHHMQEQQSTFFHNHDQDLGIKLDTAFEWNFKDLKEKIK